MDFYKKTGSRPRSTACFEFRAANGVRTRDPQLGKLMLYQLSYCRDLWWLRLMVGSRRSAMQN